MEQLVGQSLGHHQLVSLLGEGGMGAVFRARDVALQRDVAVKVMHPHLARQPHFQERFLQEARTAAHLDHPGIVKVFDFGTDQARSLLYIVMEFIPGDNLRQMLHKLRADQQWILLPEAVELLRQVCLAVDYIHREGVLHRDIKPDNLMLKPDPASYLGYRPILTDLGLAKLAEGGLVTGTGVSLGTPAYMSPEQALGDKTDARSDVYSLGILLYELAVGRLPFQVRTITEAIRCHTQESPPPPRALRPNLPESLEAVILRALAKAPDDRFVDAGVLAEALPALDAATAAVTAPPTAVQGAVSLATRYQESLVEPRGSSVLAEFSVLPAVMSGDCIQILSRDRTTRSVSMKAGGLTIGRAADNDLQLESGYASQHHARVEFDGTAYRVTDLNSTNGTFLGNVRLLPGMAEPWAPDKALRIGDTWLRLVRDQAAVSGGGTAVFGSTGVPFGPSQVGSSSAGTGRVGLFADAQPLSVDPGSSATLPFIILNQGAVVDHFLPSVDGVPVEWLPGIPGPVRLMPGQQAEVRLSIRPPRSPASRAGRYPLTVRVTSQDAPDEVAEVKQTLTVTAYSQFGTELQPQRVRAGSPARVMVHNQGNHQESYTVSWADRGNELAFEPPEVQLQVPEGQTGAAESRGRLQQRRWIGGEKAHAFSAQVRPAGGQAQVQQGELLSRGLIPAWILPLVLFLCLILTAAAAFAYQLQKQQAASATATAQAAQTAGALQIAAAETTTALADTDGDGLSDVKEISLGTDPAKRDTDDDGLSDKEEENGPTDPLKSDTDGDGLLDGEEIQWSSNPVVKDTDADGLLDGEEKGWDTNPKVKDTDGDRLQDGDEVHGWSRDGQTFHTSPIYKDTDLDGTPDTTDTDPENTPTPAPTPTTTSTPTPTPSPTKTSTPTLTPSPTRTPAPTQGPTDTPPPTHTPTLTPTPTPGLGDMHLVVEVAEPPSPPENQDGIHWALSSFKVLQYLIPRPEYCGEYPYGHDPFFIYWRRDQTNVETGLQVGQVLEVYGKCFIDAGFPAVDIGPDAPYFLRRYEW